MTRARECLHPRALVFDEVARPILASLRPASCCVQTLEHAEDDGGKEGEGYNGRKHVEPCSQFHRCLLCRDLNTGALARVAPRQPRNLGGNAPPDQQISLLQRNNSMNNSKFPNCLTR